MQEEVTAGTGVDELLRAGAARLTTVRASAVTSHKPALAAAVAAQWNERLRPFFPPGAVATISPAHQDSGSAPVEAVAVWRERVWVWAPDRSRVEGDDPRGGLSLIIVTATAWAGRDPIRGVIGEALPTDRHERAIEDELNPRHAETALGFLRPWRLQRGYALQTGGEGVIAARRALRIRGLPAYDARSVYESGGEAAPSVFAGADAVEFWVDAERGVLLRWSGRIGGEEYQATEITAVAFDEPLDERLFDPATVYEWDGDASGCGGSGSGEIAPARAAPWRRP